MKEKLELFCEAFNGQDWDWTVEASARAVGVSLCFKGPNNTCVGFYPDGADMVNARAIILMLDRLEELGYIAPTFGRVGDGRSLLIYEGQRLCPLQFTGSTRAEAVFNALLSALGQEEK